ncbi:hypothetical protein B0O99DRAFT_241826 [Bisporella sp. PMI_857]|nr:hypothetical protein B0O99DRAFT_241826 [Bisporella sp. PMI_857]
MKFAHEFQSALLREGFPEHWVASAFPYKQLKKSIKKVQKELEENNVDFSKLEEGAFEYDFQGRFSPSLTCSAFLARRLIFPPRRPETASSKTYAPLRESA